MPLLAVPMGLGGLGLAWRQAAALDAVPPLPGEAVMGVAVLAWFALVGLHALRFLRHPGDLRADWLHPFKAGFFAAASIGLMEVGAAALPYAPALAQAVLLLAVAVHVLLALLLLGRFTRGEAGEEMLVPPLLLPLVGHLVGALVCGKMGMEVLGWMLLGIGGLLWLIIMPLLVWRLLSGPGLPPPLRPSIGVILAPPTVGALAVAALAGPVGPVLWALCGLSAFILALLAIGLPHTLAAGFSPAIWAFSFPLANFASVLLLLAPLAVALPALLLVSAVIALMAAATLRAWASGRLLAPLPPVATP